jgi:hypothetical protein
MILLNIVILVSLGIVTNSGPTIGMTWRLWISCNKKSQSASGRKRSFAHMLFEGIKVRLSREHRSVPRPMA